MAKIVAASGHLEVKNCTKKSIAFPRLASWWGGAHNPLPQTPLRLTHSGLGLPFDIPSPGKKIMWAPVYKIGPDFDMIRVLGHTGFPQI